MRTRIVGLAAVLLAVTPLAARAGALSIGDSAPPITVSKWVKGEKVDALDKGQTYVVEFWATWCGPCRATIPHLTELQKKYKGVSFIGVSVWESDPKAVEPFVKEMGDKMDYRVAMDDVAADAKANEGKMANAWMKAAEEGGIPTAFIVGKDGKIAWIGHPMAMDEPLAKIVAGNWDLAAAASKRIEAKSGQKKMMELGMKIQRLMADKDKNAKELVEVLDKAIAEMPAMEMNLAPAKFEALLHGDDLKAASAYGAKLVDTLYKDNANGLNALAWAIVDPDGKLDAAKRDNNLALRAAQRANELTKGENYAILDTLAVATFANGDAAKAAEYEEKAVELAPQKDPQLTERLETYRKAAKKK